MHTHTDTHHVKYTHAHTHAGLQGQGHTSCDSGLHGRRQSGEERKEEMRREEEDRERFDDGQKMISSLQA